MGVGQVQRGWQAVPLHPVPTRVGSCPLRGRFKLPTYKDKHEKLHSRKVTILNLSLFPPSSLNTSSGSADFLEAHNSTARLHWWCGPRVLPQVDGVDHYYLCLKPEV